jgi:hypothetical protein
MTEIEVKALALLNEVQADWNYQLGSLAFKRDRDIFSEALCRAIEQHEAFKQEVSDAVGEVIESCAVTSWGAAMLDPLIIPKPKPDPLVEALAKVDFVPWKELSKHADDFRAALDAVGLEIREKDKCQ